MAGRKNTRLYEMEDAGERITALETSQASIHKDVASLTDLVGAMTRKFDSSMDDIKKQINEQSKTAWPVVLQGFSVVLVIAAFVGSFYVRDLNKVESQTEAQGIGQLQFQKEQHEKEIEMIKRLHAIELQLKK